MSFNAQVKTKYTIVANSLSMVLDPLEDIVRTDKFFEEWRNDAEASSGGKDFNEQIGLDRDEDDEEEINQAARSELDSRWTNFSHEFFNNAEMVGTSLKGWRHIQTKELKKLLTAIKEGKPVSGYKGIGIYWSWKQDAAEAHWGGGGETVVLEALIPLESINRERMAYANMSMSTGEEECEITLKEGQPVEVLKVMMDDGMRGTGKVLVQFKKPMKIKAEKQNELQ
jgi:hypothetical protein